MNPTKIPILKKQQYEYYVPKKRPNKGHFGRKLATLLSSTRGIVKAELTKEESIVPRPEDL